VSVNNNLNPQTTFKSTKTTAKDAATTAAQTKEIRISRELDGVHNTGVLGDMLTAGTSNMADANKYFALKKYAISGLLAENNQAVSSKATVATSAANAANSDIKCQDDMYLAGDPFVGGKGNNYKPVEVTADAGYYTMFQDGSASGPQFTVNAHLEAINPEGSKAYTEYGFLVKDSAGKQTKATLSGGQFTITGADGSTQKLLPPNGTYTVGNPADPDAKFYYADVPGAGKDGASEKRLMVDYYEKPTEASVKEMMAQGIKEADARKMRSTTTLSYGFRVPDGVNTYASSEGVGAGNAKKVAPNGVKTYYDSHYTEGKCATVTICDEPPPVVSPSEHARLWGDPHINDADGGEYHFQESGIFSALEDKDLKVNVKTEKLAQDPSATVTTLAGVQVGSRTVQVKADGSVTLGYAAANNNTTATLQNGQTVALDTGSSITKQGNIITLTTPEYKIQFSTNEQYKGSTYLNTDVWSTAKGVQADGVAPGGLLGETFDPDSTPQTGTKQNSAAYARGSLIQRLGTSTIAVDTTATPAVTTTTPAKTFTTPAVTPTPAKTVKKKVTTAADQEPLVATVRGNAFKKRTSKKK
jgi:hypothetical protein